ncbi:hypothetical protein MAR_037509 [Mya arenaria]|uniref:Uncharacterized protein n=1 Tax=Mya arenaria TaxID=6604 RepID=A0ABY7FNP3_MYAAR|nr:hypothetical protein MAR_037509 [Mya arenaria]
MVCTEYLCNREVASAARMTTSGDVRLPNRDDHVSSPSQTLKKTPPELPGLHNNVANLPKSAKQPNGRKKTNYFRFPPLASEFQDPRDSNDRESNRLYASGWEMSIEKKRPLWNNAYRQHYSGDLSDTREPKNDNLLENLGFLKITDSEQDDSRGFHEYNFENSVTTGPDFLPVFSGKQEKDILNVESSLDEFSSASADSVTDQSLQKPDNLDK